MHKDRLTWVYWISAVVLLAFPLAVRLFVLLSTSSADIANVADFIYDDGYYYLTIGANLAELGHSTMDGITATNGYQPLWLLVVAGVAKLVGTDPYRLFVAVCVLIYALAWISPLLALLWTRGPGRVAALCMGVGIAAVIIQQPPTFLQGLEPILMAPLAVALVVLLELNDEDPGNTIKLSAILALCFLVRLDALSLYMSVLACRPIFQAVAGKRLPDILRQIPAFTLRLSVFVIPTVVAYLALNQWLFGSAVPVSGRAKSSGGPLFSNWGISHELFGHWKPLACLLVVLVVLQLLVRGRSSKPTATTAASAPLFRRSMIIVGVAIVIQYFYYAAFSTWHVWPWYEYLFALEIALVVARIVYVASQVEGTSATARLAGLGAVLVVGGWITYRGLDFAFQSLPPATKAQLSFVRDLGIHWSQAPGTLSQEELNLQMLNDFFSPGRTTTIAMGDRAGGLAYWGRGRVAIVQTEGLTMGIDYIKARAAGQGQQYLENLPIEYLVVDREIISKFTDAGGRTEYVIPDPIQGRVTTELVPTFCFPSDAIRYSRRYPSGYASGTAYSTRIAFRFADRMPCSQQALAWLRSIVTGIGLRQYSLPSEYDSLPGGIYSKRREDRDRHYQGAPVEAQVSR